MPFTPITLQKHINKRTWILILLFAWAASQIVAYVHFGVVMSVDSGLYINNATSILAGEWPENREFLYSAYSSIIAIILFLGLKATWIVPFQVIVSGIALIGIYRITQIMSKNDLAPFIACILYIVWFEFQQWNLIVYTDSLFANSAVIAIWVLINARSKFRHLVAFILIAFSVFVRPTGIGFLIAILSYFLYDKVALLKKKPILTISVLVVFSGFCLILLNEVLSDFIASFLQSYANAEIIYPKISLGIEKPEQLYIPDDSYPSLIQLMSFIVHNPYYMLKISLFKGILFLAHIKPYYSFLHNLYIGCILYPAYFFALKGAKILPVNKLYVFIIVFIGFQVITISLTSENWDGRFLLPLLPWVFILASVGATRIFGKHLGKYSY